jgi:hypothetical protein
MAVLRLDLQPAKTCASETKRVPPSVSDTHPSHEGRIFFVASDDGLITERDEQAGEFIAISAFGSVAEVEFVDSEKPRRYEFVHQERVLNDRPACIRQDEASDSFEFFADFMLR